MKVCMLGSWVVGLCLHVAGVDVARQLAELVDETAFYEGLVAGGCGTVRVSG
jgi:hypothetical protein